MSRSVVYTCLFGHSEDLFEQPHASNSAVDFVCFTDRTDLTSQTWQIRTVPPLGVGPARESRRPKLMPHLFLSEYDQSCYIDATVLLKTGPEAFFEVLAARETDFLCLRHPWRDCIYDEAEEIIRCQIDNEVRVREQVDYYRSLGFPSGAGLIKGAFLLRRHDDAHLRRFGEDWFAHVLRYSKRDQLSFPFLAYRHGLQYSTLNLDWSSNPWFEWRAKQRLPYGFDPATYLWLNPDVARAGMDAAVHYRTYGEAEGRSWRYHQPMELNFLANQYKSDKGDFYFNRHYYTRVYDRLLRGMRNDQFTLFEIGMLRDDLQALSPGGPFHETPSLWMWADYFPNAQIHGFDIQDFSTAERDRITISRGDQSDALALRNAMGRNRYPMRVVIDDGSNASHHQQISLGSLFRELAPGGFYFIEDLNHQPAAFELPTAQKTKTFLRALAARADVSSAFIPPDDLAYLKANMASVEFFDSLDIQSASGGTDGLALIRKHP